MPKEPKEYEGSVISDIMISPKNYLFFPVFIPDFGYVRLHTVGLTRLKVHLKKGDRIRILFTEAMPSHGFNGWEFVALI
jgi:hypothetical protein